MSQATRDIKEIEEIFVNQNREAHCRDIIKIIPKSFVLSLVPFQVQTKKFEDHPPKLHSKFCPKPSPN
jgi:hypothetical protein